MLCKPEDSHSENSMPLFNNRLSLLTCKKLLCPLSLLLRIKQGSVNLILQQATDYREQFRNLLLELFMIRFFGYYIQ